MPVVEIGVKKKFRGLSTETKPTTGLSVGDEWVNTDTGEVFVWDGSTWKSALVLSSKVLASYRRTTDFSTNSTTFVEVLSVSFTTSMSMNILILASGYRYFSYGTVSYILHELDGAEIIQGYYAAGSSIPLESIAFKADVPSGSHTYKMKVRIGGTGTLTIYQPIDVAILGFSE